MKTILNTLKRFNPISIYCTIITFLLTTVPALASKTGSATGTLDLSPIEGAINQVVYLTSGPLAKLVAILAIIGGAIAFSQGREMNDAMKNVGLVAMTIGLLMAIAPLLDKIAGVVI